VQLPAVNTPQFSWVKSRLPHRAQPVPPIYQPEVIADAVTWVKDHYRRELDIGSSTAIVITGIKLSGSAGDYYLAKTGFQSQQTSEPEDPHRPNNLWAPVDEDKDYGMHGAFDSQARNRSVQLWANENRGLLAAVGAGVLGFIAAIAFKK